MKCLDFLDGKAGGEGDFTGIKPYLKQFVRGLAFPLINAHYAPFFNAFLNAFFAGTVKARLLIPDGFLPRFMLKLWA